MMVLFKMFNMQGVCLCVIFLISFAVIPNSGNSASDATRIVTIAQGPVRGYREDDSKVFGFYNIPYATAPTGKDKFKAPLPPRNWTETYDNKDELIVCPQDLAGIVTKEDCLITHIYVPDTNKTNLPVMIEVHGGAFQIGMGRLFTYNDLIKQKDIIVVNFNYRLGVHGFLCLGTEGAPGNAGMKDQLALLRWVKTNIKSFGGNPDDITIIGCSAGGVSVDLLRIASITDGLFQKVIVGSGATVGSFGLQVDPIANAKQYAAALGFRNVNDLNALEEFYKTSSYKTLYSRQDLIQGRTDSTVIFAPCVERNTGLEGVERFLEEVPVNLIKKNAIKPLPTLYGFSNMEGLIRINSFEKWTVKMNENFSQYIPADLQFETKEEREAVAVKLKQFYFSDKLVSSDTISSYIDYFSDVLFMQPMLKSVKFHKEANNESKFYLYEYSFIDERKQNYPFNVRGANHCDQFSAIYDEFFDKANLTEEYTKFKNVMRRMYIDFITTGNPISEGSSLPDWQPASSNRTPHMSFGAEISLQGPLYYERSKLWDEIYEKYYRAPISPGNGTSVLNYLSSLWLTIILFLFNHILGMKM